MPRLSQRDIAAFKDALTKIDLAGRLIGATRLAAAPLILQNLGELAVVLDGVIQRTERRMLKWRASHNKLRPEDLAAMAALETAPPQDDQAAGES